MTSPAMTIGWDEPVARAWRLMQAREIRHVPVIDADGRLVGIITDADVREAVAGLPPHERCVDPVDAPANLVAGKAMTWSADAVQPETALIEAVRLMHDRRLTALPVVEGDRVVGILTQTDVTRALIDLLGARSPAYRCGF